MHQKDKIKTITALILVSIIIAVLLLFGKEDQLSKFVAGFCFATWLIIMVIVNRKYK